VNSKLVVWTLSVTCVIVAVALIRAWLPGRKPTPTALMRVYGDGGVIVGADTSATPINVAIASRSGA
jgi:hypothetical protein